MVLPEKDWLYNLFHGLVARMIRGCPLPLAGNHSHHLQPGELHRPHHRRGAQGGWRVRPAQGAARALATEAGSHLT